MSKTCPKAVTFHPIHRTTFTIVIALLIASGCGGGGDSLSDQDIDDLEQMSSLAGLPLRASPTNAYADDEAAARFGRHLFFDEGLSASGQVSCATCHRPDHAFSEPRRVSEGVFGRLGERHAPTVWNTGHNTFFFWGGRADSLWSQALQAIEGPNEMDFSRLEVANYIHATYRNEYAEVFGPPGALPGNGAATWQSLSEAQRQSIERVFVNVGKALEAYQRQLLCVNTRFDEFMVGVGTLTDQEQRGARDFLRGGCANCHSGPHFTDGEFHNIGISHQGTPDEGREAAIASLLNDPFNGAGIYSDNQAAGQRVLNRVRDERRQLGAFKTPTLRGVGQRSHFGHLGSLRTLRDMIGHYRRRGPRGNFAGQLDPLMNRVNVDNEGDMEAFLRTLDCPMPPASLLAP